MKYVIWGCGLRGKRVIHMLGEAQRVAAIVESCEELYGSMYHGIPIISLDEFLLNYSSYPVVVTPRFYDEEIMEQLKHKNIIGAFSFSKEMLQIEGLLVQSPTDQILSRYKGNNMLAIYGASLLGLILYDILLEKGFEVSLVIPLNTSSSLKKYVRETLKLKTVSVDDVKKNDMKLLLTVELDANDQYELDGVTYDKYYDLHLQEKLYYKPKLERFKNIHKGQRCFIVATGPSLRIDDLDILNRNGAICISVNGIFKAFDKTKWRPNYYVVSDSNAYMWEDEILRMDVQAKFVADIIDCFNDKHYDNVYKWHHIKKTNDYNFPDFSDDFACGGCAGPTVVYDGALQLAVYMGFQEIYLLGTDCTVYSDGRVPHFGGDISEYGNGLRARLWQKDMMRAYQVAKQYADSHGIKIYNATRGGGLEVFPRADFDSIFN